jgi:uncharacterized protein DUF4013
VTITPETLSWPFKDSEWKNKFIIGSALVLAGSMIPLIGLLGLLVVYGYGLLIMRALIRGESPSLPKWENLGELFVDGLKAALSAFAYFVPGILLFCCAYLFLFGAVIGGAALSPASSRGVGPVFPLMFLAGEMGFLVSMGIAVIVFVIGMAPTPVAVAQYARTGEISAGYRIKEIWKVLRSNFSGFLLAWIVYVGFISVTSVSVYFAYATIVLCFLLPFILAPIGFYLSLLYAVVFGMAYRDGIANAGLVTSS